MVESDRGLHGCLVTIWERFFLLSGRHSPRWEPERRNLGGKASLKIRLPMPKIRWHVMITLQYSNRFQRRSLLVGDARSGHGQSRPSPDAGDGEATAGPNGMKAERTYCTRVRAMPAAVLAGDGFRAVHETREQSSRGVESTVAPPRHRVTNVGNHICESGGPSGGCWLPCQPAILPGPRSRRSQLE